MPSSGKPPRRKPNENLTKLLPELVNRSLVKRNRTPLRSSSLPLPQPTSFRCVMRLGPAGRELQRLDYQARNPVHVPAVPHWHGPTDQDREEENRAQADAWHRRRDTILAEAHARLAERNPSRSSGAGNRAARPQLKK